MENKLLEKINRNLEIVVGLLLRGLPESEKFQLRERILLLNNMGIRPTDIATVLGISKNHVNVELSQHRNPKKKKAQKKKRSKR